MRGSFFYVNSFGKSLTLTFLNEDVTFRNKNDFLNILVAKKIFALEHENQVGAFEIVENLHPLEHCLTRNVPNSPQV